jgi:hypothetical protein
MWALLQTTNSVWIILMQKLTWDIWMYNFLGLDGRDSILGRGKGFSLFHSVQDGFRAHSASYAVGAGCCFPGSNAAGAWSLHLVPKWRAMKLHLHSPTRLYGVVLNYSSTGITLLPYLVFSVPVCLILEEVADFLKLKCNACFIWEGIVEKWERQFRS